MVNTAPPALKNLGIKHTCSQETSKQKSKCRAAVTKITGQIRHLGGHDLVPLGVTPVTAGLGAFLGKPSAQQNSCPNRQNGKLLPYKI